MSKLICDICGNKLTGQPGNVFECCSCGAEYSLEWVREKLRDSNSLKADENKPFEKLDSEELIGLGKIALRRKEWEQAQEYFQHAVKCDKEKAEGYLGLALAEWHMSNLDDKYEWAPLSRQNINYMRALQYASVPLLKRMISARKKAQADFDNYLERIEQAHVNNASFLLPLRNRIAPAQHRISAHNEHTVGLMEDGTVIAVGTDSHDRCKIKEWRNIVAVAAGGIHTVGLKADGTVVSTKEIKSDFSNPTEWKNIIEVAAGYCHILGLMSDGTVTAAAWNRMDDEGECDVWDWHHIKSVAAGGRHTVGLRENGTVIAVGNNRYGQCDVSRWTRIVAVSAGHSHTVGLRADGTVVAAGSYGPVKCRVENWTDIIAVSAGIFHTVGLKADGTVVSEGKRENGQCRVNAWKDIVAIAAGRDHTVGLRSDGTIAVAGFRYNTAHHAEIIQEVNSWRLFKNIDCLK